MLRVGPRELLMVAVAVLVLFVVVRSILIGGPAKRDERPPAYTRKRPL